MPDERCPFCACPIGMGKYHSCQDSERDEYYRMRGDDGCPMEMREMDEMWGSMGMFGKKRKYEICDRPVIGEYKKGGK